MSEIIPNYKWSEVREMTLDEVKKLPCCEIVDDEGKSGAQAVFLMVPSTEYIRTLCDNRGQLSNSVLTMPFNKPPSVDSPLPVTIGVVPLYTTEKPKAVKPKPKARKKK